MCTTSKWGAKGDGSIILVSKAVGRRTPNTFKPRTGGTSPRTNRERSPPPCAAPPGLTISYGAPNPRLTPGATDCRRSAARKRGVAVFWPPKHWGGNSYESVQAFDNCCGHCIDWAPFYRPTRQRRGPGFDLRRSSCGHIRMRVL